MRAGILTAGVLALALAGGCAAAAPAAAPAAGAPACAGAGTEAAPGGAGDWRHPAAVTAATDWREAAVALAPGTPAEVRLAPVAGLHGPPAAGSRAATQGHGGIVVFDAPSAGTYRIMLAGHAWIDVVRDGAAIASTHHQPGPACGPVRKMVDFPLRAGRSLIVLSGSDAPRLTLMIAPTPS